MHAESFIRNLKKKPIKILGAGPIWPPWYRS